MRAPEWDAAQAQLELAPPRQRPAGRRGLAREAGRAHTARRATELQGEFIVASRRAATRRSRITLSSVGIALIVSLALGGLALLAWRQSVANERSAKSRALASAALAQLPTDPQVSVLLAVEATKQRRTAEAEQALRLSIPATHLVSTLEGQQGINAVAYNRAGTLIATGGDDKLARVWDAWTGKLRAVLRGRGDAVVLAAFSPDGSRLLTSTVGNRASLWDPETGEQVARLRGHRGEVNDVAFSPKGGLLASAGDDRTAHVRDAATGRTLTVLDGHTRAVHGVAFSPAGTIVATASGDRTARIWRSRDGRLLGTLRHRSPVSKVVFSPDGTPWRSRTAGVSPLGTFGADRGSKSSSPTPNSRPTSAFSPDSFFLATVGEDDVARVWSLYQEELLHELEGHRDQIRASCVQPERRARF